MKIWKYASHEEYVAAQVEANKRKLTRVWVDAQTIRKIAGAVKYPVSKVLCHGTRNGAEQRMFKYRYPDATIIGTEISDTATQFPDTVQHDFHEPRADWLGQFDIVYSNSWDHSYNPWKSLSTWRDQLKPGRCLFLEHGNGAAVNKSEPSDPLEISGPEVRDLLRKTGLKLIRTFKTHGGGAHPSIVYIAERRK